MSYIFSKSLLAYNFIIIYNLFFWYKKHYYILLYMDYLNLAIVLTTKPYPPLLILVNIAKSDNLSFTLFIDVSSTSYLILNAYPFCLYIFYLFFNFIIKIYFFKLF